jgi:hypothetical protein
LAVMEGQKLAEFNGGPDISSAVHQTGTIDPANRAKLVDYVTCFVPGLVPEPYAESRPGHLPSVDVGRDLANEGQPGEVFGPSGPECW